MPGRSCATALIGAVCLYPIDATHAQSVISTSADTKIAHVSAEHIVVRAKGGFPAANGRIGIQAGGGLIRRETASRSISTISSDYIAHQAPTANAFDMVALLPGANVSAADPLGFSAQTNISVRGLSGDSLGYVLEGMPLNDIAYYSGYPGQFADSENYDEISLAQGSADLDSPVLNAAGGLMTLKFRDPEKDPGGYVDFSYGSYHAERAFARLQTGEIGHSGVRGFVSYSYGDVNNWRGSGRDVRQHIDFKFVRDWNADSHVSLIGTWNNAITSFYKLLDKASWGEYGGGGVNNYAGTYDPGNASSGSDYWRLYRAPYRLFYVAAPTLLRLNNRISLSITPYAQWGYGNSPGGTTLSQSSVWEGSKQILGGISIPGAQGDVATVLADYLQSSYRAGFRPVLNVDAGHHHLTFGYWYDYSDDRQWQPYSALSSDGHVSDIWVNSAGSTLLLSDGRQLLGSNNHTITQTNALFAGDNISLFENHVIMEVGFKEVMMNRVGTNNMPGSQYHSNMNVSVPLPRVGLRWQITPSHQLFASVSTNFRMPAESALYDSYDPSSGEVDGAASANLKNEYSISEELGYRYSDQLLLGSITLFNYNFTNRQVTTIISKNGSLVSSTINAGGQTSRGVDVEFGLRPWYHFSPYASGEYLHATIDNNIEENGDLLPTRGKIAVRSPALQAAAGLTYDDGTFFGSIAVKYVGHQFATFMNDERVSDHTTGNLALGYRMASRGRIKKPEFRLNFINITDEHYLSGVASPTLNARDTTGLYGTTISGESPTYYIGGGFAVMLSISGGF